MLPKVLFIDDEPRLLHALKHSLRKEKYEILNATSAKEGLTILEREHIDVVISDEQMPGMSGSEFLVLVKRKYPQVIRMLLTGHASSEAAFRAVNEANIYRFLLKPCNSLDLLITIRRALEYKILLDKANQLLIAGEYNLQLLQKLSEQQEGILPAVITGTGGLDWNKTPKEIVALIKEMDNVVRATGKLVGNKPSEERSPATGKAQASAPTAKPAKSNNNINPVHNPRPAADGTSAGYTTPGPTAPATGVNMMPDNSTPDDWQEVKTIKDLKPIMTRSEVREHLDNCSELKGMSPTVAQILKITQNSRCSINQVVKVVKQDHAVSLKILKLANSSAYTRGEPVDTVQKAIMRIGLTQIRQAVMNISVIDQFSSNDNNHPLDITQFWEHSIATGLITAEITAAISDKSTELDMAFTMGLLHDVGRMVYLEMLGEKYNRVLEMAQMLQVPLEQVESRMLLINHADAMDRILHKWNFSKDLINPIALHQLSLGNIRRMAPNAITEVATLALANRLAHALLLGSSGNLALYPTEDFAKILKLKPDFFQKIEDDIPNQTDDMKFSMLASSSFQSWPRLCDQLSEQLSEPLRPLHISAEPQYDALRIFCNRLRSSGEDEPPNVGIIQIKRGQERVSLTEKFKQAEAEAGVSSLPLIILSPKGDIQLENRVMENRNFVLLSFPVSLSRLVAAYNQVVEPCRVAI